MSNWEIKKILKKTVSVTRKDWVSKIDDNLWDIDDNKLFASLLAKYGIRHPVSLAYHP